MKLHHYLLCIILFLLPFSNALVSFEIGIITFNVFSMGLLVTAAIAAAWSLFPETVYKFTLTDLIFGLYCLSFFMSTLMADNIIRSGFLAYQGIFIPALCYVVLKLSIKTETQFNAVFYTFLAGIILMAILGLLQGGSIQTRRFLFGLDPLSLASLLILPVLSFFFLGWWKTKWGLPLFIICFILLFLTFPRVYFVGVLISPLFYFMIRKGWMTYLFTAFFVASFAAILILITFKDDIRYEFIRGRETLTLKRLVNPDLYLLALSRRAAQYQTGLDNFLENPVIGSGIRRGRITVTTHNFHIEWLEYGGLIAYFLGAAVFFSFFSANAKPVRGDPKAAVLCCAALLVLMNCTTNGILHGMASRVIFILMGMVEAGRLIRLQVPEKPVMKYGLPVSKYGA